jgi:hypothetical protein
MSKIGFKQNMATQTQSQQCNQSADSLAQRKMRLFLESANIAFAEYIDEVFRGNVFCSNRLMNKLSASEKMLPKK